jgi:hypothetical protein
MGIHHSSIGVLYSWLRSRGVFVGYSGSELSRD